MSYDHWKTTNPDDEFLGPEPPCPGCEDGDKVPTAGYWRCPVCDAEWNDNEDDDGQPDEMTEWRDFDPDC